MSLYLIPLPTRHLEGTLFLSPDVLVSGNYKMMLMLIVHAIVDFPRLLDYPDRVLASVFRCSQLISHADAFASIHKRQSRSHLLFLTYHLHNAHNIAMEILFHHLPIYSP